MNGVLVIIPTFNEAANIASIVTRVRAAQPAAHILVVDDNSPDGTGEIVEKLSAEDASVQILHRAAKTGLGAAYLDGFSVGLTRGYDVLVEMDADGSHRPEQLQRLLDEIELGADLVIGARWVAGGSVIDWPKRREALSRGGNWYVRLMLGIDLKDATGGYRAFHRKTLTGLNLNNVESAGYCFQVDLARRAIASGFDVREVPIDFAERVRGESKMTGRIVREALWRVTVWGLDRRMGRSRH